MFRLNRKEKKENKKRKVSPLNLSLLLVCLVGIEKEIDKRKKKRGSTRKGKETKKKEVVGSGS